MKIEVTHESTTVKVDSEFLALKHIPRMTQMLLAIASGNAELDAVRYTEDWLGAAVNVYVDGVKIAPRQEASIHE